MFTAIGRATNLFLKFLYNFFKLNWEFKELWRNLKRVGVGSWIVILITGTFTGMVLVLQTGHEFVKVGAAGYVGGVVALAMARELAAVLTAMVIAGRIGSAFTAEIGSMKITEQVDALRIMSVDPEIYLVNPRVIALIFMLPILSLYSFIAGLIGGAFVAVKSVGISMVLYVNSIKTMLLMKDIVLLLVKSTVFGLLIGIVSCYNGLNTTGGATGVGSRTTLSVVISIIAILIANYILTLLFILVGG